MEIAPPGAARRLDRARRALWRRIRRLRALTLTFGQLLGESRSLHTSWLRTSNASRLRESRYLRKSASDCPLAAPCELEGRARGRPRRLPGWQFVKTWGASADVGRVMTAVDRYGALRAEPDSSAESRSA